MSGITLRDYQAECVEAVEEASARGVRTQLVVVPTGGGKTIIFSEIVRRGADSPTLILAHRDELLKQAGDKLISVAPELAMSIGYVKAGTNDVGAPVVIASVQTLSRQSRLDQLPKHFGRVIVDEGHHGTADSYQRVIDHVDSDLVLYVTATPKRADGKSLEDIAEEMVFGRSLMWMVERGYLVPPRGKRIEVDVDLGDVKQSRGDFQSEALASALEDADTPVEVLSAYEEHAEGRKTIVFAPTVAMAHHMSAVFCGAGHLAEAVDGKTPGDERAAILRRFHAGETQILCNVGVLTEGFDEPSVGCIILAAPTKSEVKYTQIIGSGLRLYPGKSDCLILDVVGASGDVSVQSLPALFGIDSLLDDEDVLTAAKREEAERVEAELEAEEGAAEQEQEEIDTAAERRRRNAESIRFFSRDRMNWSTIDDRWAIPLNKDQTLVLWPTAGEHFDVLLVNSEDETFKFLARGLDLGYAMGAAEESIRKFGNRLLADAQAAWREDEVTTGQRRYLYRLKLAIPATKGEAADLITQAAMAEMLERIEVVLVEREGAPELERVA
jgi:superfamily II DNA or RNA helicase